MFGRAPLPPPPPPSCSSDDAPHFLSFLFSIGQRQYCFFVCVFSSFESVTRRLLSVPYWEWAAVRQEARGEYLRERLGEAAGE